MFVDQIAINGKILTMNPRRPVEQAFAIAGGRIVATGSTAEIKRLAGPRTERIDFEGRMVTPGLIDTHIHVVSLGSIGAGAGLGFINTGSVLDVSKADTTQDILDAVADRVRRTAKGDWVITGWPGALKKGGKLTCRDLDAVAPDTPVMVTGYPYVIVNSLLLHQAGIARGTPAPAGGEILMDPAGDPTGVLAFQAVYQLLPPPPQPSVVETESAILQVQTAFLSEGLTAYKDVGLRDNAIKAYQNLRMRDALKCRTQMMYTWLWSPADAAKAAARFTPYGDDWLMLRSAKLSLDGGISSHTAWSSQDWFRDFAEPVPGSRGYWKIPPDDFKEMVETLHAAGLQIGCHCEGDRAIDTYLDAVEQALKKHPRTNCRHSIIHCTLPTAHAIDRMKSLGDNIVIETQAPWLGQAKWASALGPERAKTFMPFKTWLRKGITVGNSCDFPPEPFPPRFGLSSACTRQPKQSIYGDYPFGVEERLTIEEALQTYTINAAKCLFWDDRLGSIEPGKYADFVMWKEDLTTIPPESVKDATVLLTAIEGEVVFRRPPS